MSSLSLMFAWRTISSPYEHYMPQRFWLASLNATNAEPGSGSTMAKDSDGFVRAIARGFAVVEALGRPPGRHTLSEVAVDRRAQSRHRAARSVDAGRAEILRRGWPLFQPAPARARSGPVLSQCAALLGLCAARAGRPAQRDRRILRAGGARRNRNRLRAAAAGAADSVRQSRHRQPPARASGVARPRHAGVIAERRARSVSAVGGADAGHPRTVTDAVVSTGSSTSSRPRVTPGSMANSIRRSAASRCRCAIRPDG